MNSSDNNLDLLNSSRLFDADWYSDQFPDVAMAEMSPAYHYLHFGNFLGRNPSFRFDGGKYLEQNEDVAAAGFNPLLHYLKHGSREGRPIYPFGDKLLEWPTDVEALLESDCVYESGQLGPELRAELLSASPDGGVSVIMPAWNRRAIIGRAVRSAFDQSLSPMEVIVADDGSTDGTLDVLREEFANEVASGRLVLLECDHGGVSHARNQALARAQGDYIAYLDSDNEWHPDHLMYTVGVLSRHPNHNSAYAAVRINRVGETRRKILSTRFDRERLLRHNFIDLNAFVHRRSVYRALGGFDQSLRRLVDWDLVMRYTEDVVPLRIPVVTVEYYLDAEAFGNITFTERLDLARDTVFLKHREEYLSRKILADDQLKRIATRVKELRASTVEEAGLALSCFYVVLSEPEQVPRFSAFSGLDVPVVVLAANRHGYRVLASNSSTLSIDAVLHFPPTGVYWCPDPAQPLPHIEQLRALYLTVATGQFDLAVVSYSLANTEQIVASCLRNQVVVSDKLVAEWLATDQHLTLGASKGKILRMLPVAGTAVHPVAPSAFLGAGVKVESKNLTLHQGMMDASTVWHMRSTLPELRYAKDKPVVLVLPMKLAIGGVERNTVEVMRALRDRYDFVYVTMEKIYPEQGSLAAQALEVVHRLVDMAEISAHEHYLEILRMLKRAYQPDLVWICNGSMWMCKHALGVREIFDDVPIIDQQVYDVAEGWIRRYTEPGIQSFDRFIAINTKIRQRFLGDFGMDPARVDLIYSAVDSEKFRQRKAELRPVEELRAKYRLPEGRRIFAFMGRLVEQKRPLDFLALAALRAAHADEHYVLIGNGVLAPRVEEWFQENTQASAQWIHYVENTAELWSLVDAQVITSAYEGLPIAMIEALSMGVPVISTNVGDIGPVLHDHKAGVVVDAIGDSRQMSAKLDRLIEALPVMRAHLQEESERVLDRFSAQAIAEQYHQSWQAGIARRRTMPGKG